MTPTIRLSITTPCTENWNQMTPGTAGTPGTQGRFCASCQKTVVDLTAMDDHELLRWFEARAQAPVCGRLRTDQLDRSLTPSPSPQKNRRFWNYLVAGLLFSTEAAAQSKPASPSTNQYLPIRPTAAVPHLLGDTVLAAEKPFPTDSVRGRVVDSSGSPVSFASIMFGPKAGVLADEQGYFTIDAHKVSRYQQLTISAVGYRPVNINVDHLLTEHQVNMPERVYLQEVVSIAGGITAVVTKKRRKKIAADTLSLFNDTLALVGLTKPALTVYPNPVARGAAITISARLDHTGKYSLQLYSASGALVESRELEQGELEQGEPEQAAYSGKQELPIPAGLVPGIYFVKLSHPAMTKCYSQQIVVY